MDASITVERVYKPWLLVIPPEASEFFEWEFLDFITEDEAKTEALKRQLEKFDAPYYVLHKQCCGVLIREMTMSPDDVLKKFGDDQKKKIDKHIESTVAETQDEEDSLQYVDDIVYDIESDLGQTLSEEDEESLEQYVRDEIKRRWSEK